RLAPSPMSRSTSAAWSSGRRSKCSGFLPTPTGSDVSEDPLMPALPGVGSGTRMNSRSGLTPSSGLPSGGSRTISPPSADTWVRPHPGAAAQKVARGSGPGQSTTTHCQRRLTRRSSVVVVLVLVDQPLLRIVDVVGLEHLDPAGHHPPERLDAVLEPVRV